MLRFSSETYDNGYWLSQQSVVDLRQTNRTEGKYNKPKGRALRCEEKVATCTNENTPSFFISFQSFPFLSRAIFKSQFEMRRKNNRGEKNVSKRKQATRIENNSSENILRNVTLRFVTVCFVRAPFFVFAPVTLVPLDRKSSRIAV